MEQPQAPLTGANIFGYSVKITTVEKEGEVYGFLFITGNDPVVRREIGFVWDRLSDEIRIEKGYAYNALVYGVIRGAISMLRYVFEEAKGDFVRVLDKVVKEGKEPLVAQQEIAQENEHEATISSVYKALGKNDDEEGGAPPGGWAH